MGKAGLKHTRNCISCGVKLNKSNWYPSFVGKKHYKCKSCYDERRILNRYKKKYGSSTKALAKFISNTVKNKYDAVLEGQVYVIRNPAFPGWCKVGMAVDALDRLKQYQTSSPYRDYELVVSFDSKDRRKDESKAHELLGKHYAFRSEWFFGDASLIIDKLNTLFNKDSNENS